MVAGGGFAALAYGQWRFADGHPSRLAFPMWAAGMIACASAIGPLIARQTPSTVCDLKPRTGWISRRTIGPAAIAVATWVAALWVQRSRPPAANRWDLVTVWVLGTSCAFAAAWQPSPRPLRGALRSWSRPRFRKIITLAALFVAGAGLTFTRLDSLPRTFNGDEGGFALVSKQVVNGQISNPFGVGYLGHPMLSHVVQAVPIWIFGPSVTAARSVSALWGALCLPLAYVVGARLTGSWRTGLIAAALLATFPPHLYWSRSALPNAASEFFVLAVLLLLDKAGRAGGPATFVATGLVLGAAQYFYFSNRVLIPVVAVALTVHSCASWRAGGRGWRSLRTLSSRISMVLFGFVSMTAPLIGFYAANPGQFNNRFRQVSLLQGSSLADKSRATGHSAQRIVWDNAVSASMLPFRSRPQGFFRGDIPFVGWPIALLCAVGLALAISRVGQWQWTGLVATLALTVAGLAITTGPTDTNRWVAVIPLVCLLAAVGLDTLVSASVASFPSARLGLIAAALVAAGLTATWNLYEFTRGDNTVFKYTDLNTQVAEQAAQSILTIDARARVFFFGAPRMTYTGFGDLVYRTPDAVATDVVGRTSLGGERVKLDPQRSTIFVVLPERYSELEVVMAWYPHGRERIVSSDGIEMFRMWVVNASPRGKLGGAR